MGAPSLNPLPDRERTKERAVIQPGRRPGNQEILIAPSALTADPLCAALGSASFSPWQGEKFGGASFLPLEPAFVLSIAGMQSGD